MEIGKYDKLLRLRHLGLTLTPLQMTRLGPADTLDQKIRLEILGMNIEETSKGLIRFLKTFE